MAAKKIIAPRLGRFHRAHPDVVLDIVIDDGLSDIVAGQFDAGIRVGERLEKDMIAVRLTPDVRMLALASPDYLSQRGEPRTPADLHLHACINWRFPGSGRIYHWEFERKGKKLEMAVNGPLIANHQDVVLEGRFRQALTQLNPALPPEAVEDAFRKLTRLSAPTLMERNRAMHRMLVDGITVEYRPKGRINRRRSSKGHRFR